MLRKIAAAAAGRASWLQSVSNKRAASGDGKLEIPCGGPVRDRAGNCRERFGGPAAGHKKPRLGRRGAGADAQWEGQRLGIQTTA